jgi:hypothetical protein
MYLGLVWIKSNEFPLTHYKNISVIIFIGLITIIGFISGIITIIGMIYIK